MKQLLCVQELFDDGFYHSVTRWETDEEEAKREAEELEYHNTDEYKYNRIRELKENLSNTDYVVVKIAEGEATKEQYENVLSQRKQWRIEINQLETQLGV